MPGALGPGPREGTTCEERKEAWPTDQIFTIFAKLLPKFLLASPAAAFLILSRDGALGPDVRSPHRVGHTSF